MLFRLQEFIPICIAMVENLRTMKVISAVISLFLCYSCGMNKRFNSTVEEASKGTIITPIAMAQFLTESASEIYSRDTLQDDTEVVIKNLDVVFKSRSGSFKLNMEEVKFHFSNDSLYFNDVTLPIYKGYIGCDSLTSFVRCLYKTPKKEDVRCLHGIYILTKKEISRLNYQPCLPDH